MGLLILVFLGGCGGETGEDRRAAAITADRQKADGEGLAEFIVDGFNEGILRCDYKRVAAGLRQEIRRLCCFRG